LYVFSHFIVKNMPIEMNNIPMIVPKITIMIKPVSFVCEAGLEEVCLLSCKSLKSQNVFCLLLYSSKFWILFPMSIDSEIFCGLFVVPFVELTEIILCCSFSFWDLFPNKQNQSKILKRKCIRNEEFWKFSHHYILCLRSDFWLMNHFEAQNLPQNLICGS